MSTEYVLAVAGVSFVIGGFMGFCVVALFSASNCAKCREDRMLNKSENSDLGEVYHP